MGEEKRILILALGTGTGKQDNSEDVVSRILEGGDSYRLATYQLGELVQSSAFVAKILIEYYQPSEIILLGTGRSNWTGFYHSFCPDWRIQNEIVDVKREMNTLHQIELHCNMRTETKELDRHMQMINRIYQSGSICHKGQYKPSVHVILTHYGINQEELAKNYERIKLIEQYLSKESTNHVAFDITHSFRSLPIYNLTILNYIRNISEYTLIIDHVFYGNLEASGENNNIAPVVDLKDLIHTMDLTNGVKEFSDTGNAVTLLKDAELEDDEYKKLLEQYSWAMQLNSSTEIREIVAKLITYKQRNGDATADVSIMVRRMLRNTLLKGDIVCEYLSRENEDAVFKLRLSKWYLQQKQYGLALAVMCEALRSMIVVFYTQKKETYMDEGTRKCALDRMIKLHKQYQKEKSQNNRVIIDAHNVIQCYLCSKTLRNVFAHNLTQTEVKCDCERCRVDDSEFITKKRMVDTFFGYLLSFCKALDDSKYRDTFQRLCEQKQSKAPKKRDNVCLIISNNKEPMTKDIVEALGARLGNKRITYQLPLPLRKMIANKNNDGDTVMLHAKLLREYIDMYMDSESISIILFNLYPKQLFTYGAYLRRSYNQVSYIPDKTSTSSSKFIPKCYFCDDFSKVDSMDTESYTDILSSEPELLWKKEENNE